MTEHVGALRDEVAALRAEVVDKLGGQLRLERIETTRVIGSDLEALQHEIRRLAGGQATIRQVSAPLPHARDGHEAGVDSPAAGTARWRAEQQTADIVDAEVIEAEHASDPDEVHPAVTRPDSGSPATAAEPTAAATEPAPAAAAATGLLSGCCRCDASRPRPARPTGLAGRRLPSLPPRRYHPSRPVERPAEQAPAAAEQAPDRRAGPGSDEPASRQAAAGRRSDAAE